MESKRRLCIYCHYDKNGVVEEWDRYLISELCTISADIIIVVNGSVGKDGINFFEAISDEVYVRPNVGLDAKAYEYVILECLSMERFHEYDELILCNNTFFGPFISFRDIFKTMEKKAIDFWGFDYGERGVYQYIRSYFLVFRRRILKDDAIVLFFQNNVRYRIENLYDAIQLFEVGISNFLEQRGYLWDTYSYTEMCSATVHSAVCIRDYGLPLLRKRACRYEDIENQFNYYNVFLSIAYIREKYQYETNWIIKYMEDSFATSFKNVKLLNYSVEGYNSGYMKCRIKRTILKRILENRDNLYFYGAGRMAGQLWVVFRDIMKDFRGFLVSDDNEVKKKQLKWGYPVKRLSEIENNCFIVIAALTEVSDMMEVELIKRGYTEYLRVW